MTRKKERLLADFDSPCYFSYLTGCGDIKKGQPIIHIGFRMSWHRKCQPEDL